MPPRCPGAPGIELGGGVEPGEVEVDDHDVADAASRKGDYVVHPDPIILNWAADIGVKLTIGSDAHRPESVGQKYNEVLPLLKKTGFKELHYFIKGKRRAVTIPK